MILVSSLEFLLIPRERAGDSRGVTGVIRESLKCHYNYRDALAVLFVNG